MKTASSWFFDQPGRAEQAISELVDRWDCLFDSDEQCVRSIMLRLGAVSEEGWPEGCAISKVASLQCVLSLGDTSSMSPPIIGDILLAAGGALAIYAGRNVIFHRENNKAHFGGVNAFRPTTIYRFSI